MFKKALKIAIAFSILLASYVGYVRLFAIVAERAARSRPRVAPLVYTDSQTKKDAIALAIRAFGTDHWSADRELQGRYYNKERGYWMYYKEYKRLNEGKQFLFTPFALIWQSKDKRELKTVTADEAVMELDRPLGLAMNKPGAAPMRVIHAQVTGNVNIRDDRGTASRADDLLIGPMPYIEYDEASLQVKSESDVVIQDREMWVNGYDMIIQLRPKDEDNPSDTAAGFNGAKSAILKKNIHIILYDSGNSGILPGKPNPGAAGKGGAPERTPVDLRADGQMQIDLPRPRLPVRVGPPAPPAPTIATFMRNVVVLQGKPNQTPDELNCDHLKLTLLPADKPATPSPTPGPPAANAPAPAPAGSGSRSVSNSEAGAPAEEEGSGGTLGSLTLRRADATGHAVFLRSPSQGLKTTSNELIFKKLAPEKPDETYLRGDAATKLFIEKVEVAKEGPNQGKIESITTIRTVDATIFNDGQSRDPETIVARGPGILETRPARDKPVERRAIWGDYLLMQNEIRAHLPPRKRITLKGDPRFIDVAQTTTLDSKDEIIVWLRPRPEPMSASESSSAAGATAIAAAGSASAMATAPAPAQAPAGPGTGKYEIEMLRAIVDVHLIAPGRNLAARDVLIAVFETPPAATTTATAGVASSAAPVASGTGAARASGPAAGPAPTPAPGAPDAQGVAKVEMKPAEPDINVRANQVWARLASPPKAEPDIATNPASDAGNRDRSRGGNTRFEVREARLRGAVAFHQDPRPGKERGTDVHGEAIDLLNLGESLMYFKVFHVDPDKVVPAAQRTKLSPGEILARIEAFGKAFSFPLARVETDEFTVEGPQIGLNQLSDEAWVSGHGDLIQLAPRGLLSDKGLEGTSTPARPAQDKDKAVSRTDAKAKADVTPLKISWTERMHFKGRSVNPRGVPVARAEFYGNVRGEMEDSLLVCQQMTTYMDRLVKLNRPRRPRTPGDGNGNPNEMAEPEPKPQIALIDCLRQVVVDNRKRDPSTGAILERDVIDGDHVVYDKLTGQFLATPAEGQVGKVYLYSREGQNSLVNPLMAPVPGTEPSATANRRPIRPTANPSPSPSSGPAPNTRRATEVIGRNGAADPTSARANAASKTALPPLKLTQIFYSDEMHGRFGTGKQGDTTESRWADFFGDVEAMHATVANENVTLDFDNPPQDGSILTAQIIRVVSEPPPPGSKAPARNFLKAWDQANAETIDTTIQADKITYDSSKELFYAYGEVDQVYIVQQKNLGQPATTSSGRTVWYNRRTGESHVDDPTTVQLIDDKTGIRPGRAIQKEQPTKPKKPLAPFRGPARSHFERKGFNGH